MVGRKLAPGGQEGKPAIYCLVPPELAELREVLTGGVGSDAPVEIVVDRRRGERRSGADRRRRVGRPPAGIERRLALDLEGRRVVERRSRLVPVEAQPSLPPDARPYAEHLRFMRRDQPVGPQRDPARLRTLVSGWRERCRGLDRETKANLIRSQTEGRNALAAALGTRGNYTWEHSAAVVWLTLECAEEIGLGEREVAEIHDVALLHDIGKLGVPDTILRKRGPLSDAEWEIMREHPVIGARLVDSLDTLRHLAPAVRAEHERWDGRGYPDGLIGDQIPIASRIVFACDAYHAMVSERPYRDPLSPEAARAELARGLGSQFWSEAAGALLTVLERTEPRDRSRAAVPRRISLSGEPERAPGGESERAAGDARRRDRDRSPAERGEAEASPGKGHRRLLEQAGTQFEHTRSAAQRHEAARRPAAAQRDALRQAMERLLEVTRRRHGYSPRVFLARVRAEEAIRDADPRDLDPPG